MPEMNKAVDRTRSTVTGAAVKLGRPMRAQSHPKWSQGAEPQAPSQDQQGAREQATSDGTSSQNMNLKKDLHLEN